MSDFPALNLQGVHRSFMQGEEELQILKDVNLTINPGEIVALVGPSGAGKSTLLQIAGLLEKPDQGVVEICGEDCGGMNDDARTLVRRQKLGFVYQYTTFFRNSRRLKTS